MLLPVVANTTIYLTSCAHLLYPAFGGAPLGRHRALWALVRPPAGHNFMSSNPKGSRLASGQSQGVPGFRQSEYVQNPSKKGFCRRIPRVSSSPRSMQPVQIHFDPSGCCGAPYTRVRAFCTTFTKRREQHSHVVILCLLFLLLAAEGPNGPRHQVHLNSLPVMQWVLWLQNASLLPAEGLRARCFQRRA